MKKNSLKYKLNQKEITIGSWLTFSDPSIAEIMAKSGFDWLVVDMEHSGLSINQAQEIIRVIDLCNVTPLVRVSENNPDLIKRFMDIGAHGVIVPMVNSKRDAERAVSAVKYPPVGTRGVGLSRAQKYSLDLESYRKWNQENSIVIVQIENIKGVENINSIMDVDGVDGLIVGPYDLSASLGHPGEFEHPLVRDTFKTITTTIIKSPKPWGYHVVEPNIDEVLVKLNQGYKFVAFGVDFLFFSINCNDKMNLIRKKIIDL
jgi:2-keto-3-deoxy-L-rhamnonate aldolase RhmA